MKFKVIVEKTMYSGSYEYEIEPIENVDSAETAIRRLSLKPDRLVDHDAIPVDISGAYDKKDGSVYSVIGTRCAEWIRLEKIKEDK